MRVLLFSTFLERERGEGAQGAEWGCFKFQTYFVCFMPFYFISFSYNWRVVLSFQTLTPQRFLFKFSNIQKISTVLMQ